MTADAKSSTPLHVEWERIYLLSTSAIALRQGQTLSDVTLSKLNSLQNEVHEIRSQPPWSHLVASCDLLPIDQDIAACTLGPDAEPRLGWLFHELQPGANSPYPTPALIHELFAMERSGSTDLESRLTPGAPLQRHRLIAKRHPDFYQPLRSTNVLRGQLLQRPMDGPSITGAIEIPTLRTWDDLILPRRCKERLLEIVLWETHRYKVFEEWGARRLGGPVALFAGTSGTGKTLAAEGLARALNKRLFRVDLGLLVSKYVGETEKNLNMLFESAEATGVILLFDEADSLFGRRGEIRDARDRYANMEISHLLSRIERHHGVCVLTSNLRNHVDPAFLRRFHFVVDFPRPDANARSELWALHVPPRAQCAPDVDLRKIGRDVNLSGGQIHNAALRAAFLAAADGECIHNRHIAFAVWDELSKRGGETLLVDEIGHLAAHLTRETRAT